MFGKNKEETKPTPVIPEGDLRIRKSSGGKFALNKKNELVFRKTIETKVFDPVLRAWVKQKPVTQEIPVQEMHWEKEILDNIVVKKLVPSRTQIDGVEALFFLQTLVYRVRPELKYVYLQREERSRKIFLKDFDTGICYQAPHTTNQYIFVETIDTKPISKDQVLELYESGKISDVYSDVLETGEGPLYKKQVYVK